MAPYKGYMYSELGERRFGEDLLTKNKNTTLAGRKTINITNVHLKQDERKCIYIKIMDSIGVAMMPLLPL